MSPPRWSSPSPRTCGAGRRRSLRRRAQRPVAHRRPRSHGERRELGAAPGVITASSRRPSANVVRRSGRHGLPREPAKPAIDRRPAGGSTGFSRPLRCRGIAGEAGGAPGVEVSRRELPEAELHAMLYRRPVFGPGDWREKTLGMEGCDLVLLPGSFDPCHEGHQMIADAVERQYGRRVAYAITADPVHKPSLRAVDLLDRIASIRLGAGRTRTLVLTERDPLFIDKARQFPGAGIALGVDALVRMLDPAWGPNVGEMLEAFVRSAPGSTSSAGPSTATGRRSMTCRFPDRFRRLFESVRFVMMSARRRCAVCTTSASLEVNDGLASGTTAAQPAHATRPDSHRRRWGRLRCVRRAPARRGPPSRRQAGIPGESHVHVPG